jgi:hypothetical protein
MPLTRLWVGLLTRRNKNSGTDGRVTLSINAGGEQLLNQPLLPLIDTARASLFKFNVEGKRIEPGSLTSSSLRLHISDRQTISGGGIDGDDAWKPERFFVWGEEAPPPLVDIGVVPLAIEMSITETLSTDASEGVRSIPLRLVAKGNRDMRINRLLVLLATDVTQNGSSTDHSLEIQIVSNDRLVALCEIKNTAQNDLHALSNFYTMPVILPFTRSSLNNGTITLRIKGGMDDWKPLRFFLFGLDDATGRPESIVPLVHLGEWPFGTMSPDTTNGIASVTLPLAVGSF